VDAILLLTDGSSAPADVPAVQRALKDGTLLWLDVLQPGSEDIVGLSEALQLHPLAAEDLTAFGQRPKVEDFGNLVYFVTYGLSGNVGDDPGFDVSKLGVTEVHCFFAENFLITVRHGGCQSIEQMRKRVQARAAELVGEALLPGADQPGMAGQPGSGRPVRLILLHHLMHGLTDSFFPALASFDDRIDELQEQIFAKPTNDQLAQLFGMQRWLVQTRKLISPQRDVLASLVSGMVNLPGMSAESDPYLRDLYDLLIRISDMIDSYRDLLSNAMSAYLSIVSNNLNVVMKQLTIIATIFLPLSFLTGFFGQNFAWLVNELGSLPTFIVLGLGTEALAVVGLYTMFRRRGWIGGS
jgi:magnesium transporter